jgi:hypothetical protein
MPRTKPLRLLLGLRLRDPAGEAGRRTAEAFLEEAAALLPRLPVAWNLPLAHLEAGKGRADLAVEIKTRVRGRSDSVLLMGYSGAPHPLLSADELEKELAWCRRSPWGTGARALLGQEPRHLLPLAADLTRETLDGVYGRHGFASVGLAEPLEQALARFSGPGRAAYRFPARRTPGRVTLHPAWVWSAGTEPSALQAAAGIAGRQPLFLLLEPETEPGSQPKPLLADLLQALGARYQPQFLSLEEALAGEGQEDRKPARPASGAQAPAGTAPDSRSLAVPDPLPLLCPSVMEAASRAEALRAKPRRRTDADLRAVLETWASPPPHARGATRAHETRRAPEPSLVAAMSGLVALQGDGLTATFADGRLSGLQRARGWALGAGPADSYLIAEGRFLPLESESAFSFEQGQDTGLRSVLKAPLGGGEAELIIQACFREGQEELELGFRLRFPELSPKLDLQGVVPLELPVFALASGERAAVSGELLGGGSFTRSLEPEEGESLFTGARLRLNKAGGGPALVFSPVAPSGVVVLGVRVIRLRRGLHVLASPFGARFAAPARLYSGRTLSFSLRLGLEE